MTTHRTTKIKSFRLLLLIALIATFAACSSSGHINTLRSAQDSFTAVAEAEIAKEGQHFELRVDALDRSKLEEALSKNLGWDAAPYFLAEYGKLRDVLAALIAEDEAALAADKLLGVAKTLEIYSRWRMAYYAHLLNVLGQLDDVTAQDSSKLIPLTVIATDAEDLAEDAKISDQLFPRDRFLLMMLSGMAQFDAVLLTVAQVQREHSGQYNTDAHRQALKDALGGMRASYDAVAEVTPKAKAFLDYQAKVLATIQSSFDELKLLLPRAMRPTF
ncbi:MAG: hypothetical protein ACI97A_002944 [Planctomycetota bacterium]|jgi:hypothetical protein